MNFTILQNRVENFYYKQKLFLGRLSFLWVIALLFSCSGAHKDRTKAEEAFMHIIDSADNKIDSGHATGALNYLELAVNARKPLTVREQFEYYRFYCSYYLHYTQESAKALAYADSMLRLIEKQDQPNVYATELTEANYSLGDILFVQKKYSEAYRYFYTARQIGKNTFNPCTISDYSYRMGMILYQQERYEPAINYFQRSLTESQNCSSDFSAFYRQQELLNNTALCYTRMGKADSALHYYAAALDYINRNDGRFPEKKQFYAVARGVIYGNQGLIYQSKGELGLAEKLFRKSIGINSQPNYDNKDAEYVRLHLTGLLLEQNRLGEVETGLDEIRRNLDKAPNADANLNFRGLQWQFYEKKGDAKRALTELLSYNRLKDSIAKATRDLTTANASEQLDNLEKQYEISSLKKNKESDQVYFRILIVVAILSIAVILLIFQNWRRSKNKFAELRHLNKQVMEQKLRLEQTLAELEHQAREKDRILRAVAHDLRNPIGGVASLSALLLEDHLTDEHAEMLNLIKETCHDALLLINEILEIAVAEPDLPKEVINVNMLLFNAIELLRFKAVEKDQQLVLEGLATGATVMANREKLGRVVSNLVSNAIKFSRTGGKVVVRAQQVENHIRIAVEDNGIGIPDSIKGKVFDTFTEAKRSGTSGEKPFGLGLSISKQLIEATGGSIWFESNPQGGSIFYIQLDRYTGAQEHRLPDLVSGSHLN